MKHEFVNKLGCCYDNSQLELQIEEESDKEIIRGKLACSVCNKIFPIVDGIPRILPQEMLSIVKSTAETFGFEWKKFNEYFDFNESEFLDLINPFFDHMFLKGKSVLDAGCGSGMYSRFFGKYGSPDVTLLDLSGAIEVAKKNIKNQHYEFVQGDIINAPFKEKTFDFILSKGVLHHLSDPFKGFQKLVSLLKDGGVILFWVYGKENNSLLAKYSNILRKRFFSKLSLRSRKILSLVAAIILFGILRGIYRTVGKINLKIVKILLPNFDLFYQQSFYPFRHIHFGCFDHLSAPIAYYYTKEDLEYWMKNLSMTDYKITNRWNMSWAVFAKKLIQ